MNIIISIVALVRFLIELFKPYIPIVVAVIGLLLIIDGIGSVMIKSGQYHNFWFDGERYIRAFAGLILIFIGLVLEGTI